MKNGISVIMNRQDHYLHISICSGSYVERKRLYDDLKKLYQGRKLPIKRVSVRFLVSKQVAGSIEKVEKVIKEVEEFYRRFYGNIELKVIETRYVEEDPIIEL